MTARRSVIFGNGTEKRGSSCRNLQLPRDCILLWAMTPNAAAWLCLADSVKAIASATPGNGTARLGRASMSRGHRREPNTKECMCPAPALRFAAASLAREWPSRIERESMTCGYGMEQLGKKLSRQIEK